MALLGGSGRLWGPLVGVIPFTIIWEWTSIQFPNQSTLFLGFTFLLIVYVLPKGIVGLMEKFTKAEAVEKITPVALPQGAGE